MNLPSSNTQNSRIFISHSHEDNIFGVRLVQDLRHALGDNDAVWYDKLGGLKGGAVWWPTIMTQLKARPIFIVILSPDALKSEWVKDEMNIAWKLKHSKEGKHIIPVNYSLNPNDVPDDYDTLEAISFLPPTTYEEGFNNLLAALGISPLPSTFSSQQISTHPPSSTPTSATSPASVKKSSVNISKTIALAILALLVVTVGLISFLAIRGYNSGIGQNDLTATAHARLIAQARGSTNPTSTERTSSTPLSTAQANLTATAQINLTATTQQIATFDASSSNPYPPRTGSLKVNDPLKNNAVGGWDSTGSFPGCSFTNNSYHVTITSQNSQECNYTAIPSFTNFVYQIELRIVSTNTCGYIFFREYYPPILNLRTSYSFQICVDGSYSLTSEQNSASLSNNLPRGSSPFIKQGVGQLNLIAVVANGINLDLYVNGNKLAHVSDSTSGQGSIGVGANSSSKQSAVGEEVDFNDVKVWTLS